MTARTQPWPVPTPAVTMRRPSAYQALIAPLLCATTGLHAVGARLRSTGKIVPR